MKTTTILVNQILKETPKAILADIDGVENGFETWLPKSQITKLAYAGSGEKGKDGKPLHRTYYRIPLWLASKKGIKGENTADALEGAVFRKDAVRFDDETAAQGEIERTTFDESDERERAEKYEDDPRYASRKWREEWADETVPF